MVGVLALGLGFVFSYVGAFHHPVPHRVAIAVVAPAGDSRSLVERLDALRGAPLRARPAASAAAARGLLRADRVAAALLVDPRGRKDRLLVAGGGGAALSTAVQAVVTRSDAARHRVVATTDIVPLQSGDYRGLTGFYLVVGCLVAGYLLAAIFGITLGPRAATVGQAAGRLLAIVPYSLAVGVGAALIVGPLLGALTGHFAAVAGVGALLTFAAGAVTVALESLLGMVGIGLAILVFVVLGNPSAGGAYQNALLPGFWRAIGDGLPNGAGVDAIRRAVYFGGHGIAERLIVIAAYGIAAAGITLVLGRLRRPRTEDVRGDARQTPSPGRVRVATQLSPPSLRIVGLSRPRRRMRPRSSNAPE
jgi:hypothetical protein